MGTVEPDRLTEEENASVGSDKQTDAICEEAWVVRLERRDAECQFRFIDRHCCVNSRLSAAWRLSKDVARQLARAINEQHPKYKAKALLYSTMRKRQEVTK